MLYLTYSFDWEDHARKAKDLKINSKVTKRETKSRKYYFTTTLPIYLVSTYIHFHNLGKDTKLG